MSVQVMRFLRGGWVPQIMEDIVGLVFFVTQTTEKIWGAIQLVPRATSLRGADCGLPGHRSWRTSPQPPQPPHTVDELKRDFSVTFLWKHEQLGVAMASAAATHHSARRGECRVPNEALWGQETASAAGGRRLCLGWPVRKERQSRSDTWLLRCPSCARHRWLTRRLRPSMVAPSPTSWPSNC